MDQHNNGRRLIKIAPDNRPLLNHSNQTGNFFIQPSQPRYSSEPQGPYRRIAPNNYYIPPVYNIPVIEQSRCVVKNCDKSYDDNSRLFTHIKAKHRLPPEETCECYCSKCFLTVESDPLVFYQTHYKTHTRRPPSLRTRNNRKKKSKEEALFEQGNSSQVGKNIEARKAKTPSPNAPSAILPAPNPAPLPPQISDEVKQTFSQLGSSTLAHNEPSALLGSGIPELDDDAFNYMSNMPDTDF